MKRGWTLLAIAMVCLGMQGKAAAHEGHEGGVFFLQPQDGAVLVSPVHVKMGVKGMRVEAAGQANPGAGHFHLIIDGAYVPKGEIVPKDATHLHFGKGQRETDLTLSPGEHTLTLQFADGHHVSYGKAWSRTIHVKVKGR